MSVYEPSPGEIRRACDAILAADTPDGLENRRQGWWKGKPRKPPRGSKQRDEETGAAVYTIPVCRRHI